MNRYKRLLFNVLLGVATCLLLTNIAAPMMAGAKTAESALQNENIVRYEQEALAFLVSQGETLSQESSPRPTLMRFNTSLTGKSIVPKPVSTRATGEVGAVLVGNRFVVRGGFRNLSSALRNYATDPLSPPNPNITSAVHIHQGVAKENGPFQYALQVEVNSAEGRSGTFRGEYALTPEQISALMDGRIYVDLHTKARRGGELRGIIKNSGDTAMLQ